MSEAGGGGGAISRLPPPPHIKCDPVPPFNYFPLPEIPLFTYIILTIHLTHLILKKRLFQ